MVLKQTAKVAKKIGDFSVSQKIILLQIANKPKNNYFCISSQRATIHLLNN